MRSARAAGIRSVKTSGGSRKCESPEFAQILSLIIDPFCGSDFVLYAVRILRSTSVVARRPGEPVLLGQPRPVPLEVRFVAQHHHRFGAAEDGAGARERQFALDVPPLLVLSRHPGPGVQRAL